MCDSFGETEAILRKSARRIEPDTDTDSSDSEWRHEVTRRLGDYRARQRRLHGEKESPQERPSVLPPTNRAEKHDPSPVRAPARPGKADRVDIWIQPGFDFSKFHDDRAHPQTALVPVASLSERRWAGILDALFITGTAAGFWSLFHALGGEIVFNKLDVAICVAILYLFYSQYFLLFTALAGATPGMRIQGLITVRLDGGLPDTRQLLWRSFGYLLSGVTALLGFFWALWDEDHFTWQDRISHTYVTAASPFGVRSAGNGEN